MKKNKMMRIASVLLVAVLISTCAISGTFAKYVTKAEGTDTARVAKWGILLTVDGEDVFGTEYKAQDEGYIAAVMNDNDVEEDEVLSVISSTEDKVVAPGTSSTILGTNLVATVTGTPEVATRYTLVAKKLSDIVLPTGVYTDYTNLVKTDDGYGYFDTFEIKKDYSPIKWNMTIEGKGQTIDLAARLWEEMADYQDKLANYGFSAEGVSIFDAIKIIKKVAGNSVYELAVGNVLSTVVSGGHNFQLDVTTETVGEGEAAETYDVLTLSYDFEPNKAMDFKFTLDWEWAFEQEDVELYDKADTYLGNMIVAELEAAEATEATTEETEKTQLQADYSDFDGSLWIAATFTATATQID